MYVYTYIYIYIYIYIHSEAQQVGNTFCNHNFAVTLFTYSEVLSCMGFIPTLFTALQTSPPALGRILFCCDVGTASTS